MELAAGRAGTGIIQEAGLACEEASRCYLWLKCGHGDVLKLLRLSCNFIYLNIIGLWLFNGQLIVQDNTSVLFWTVYCTSVLSPPRQPIQKVGLEESITCQSACKSKFERGEALLLQKMHKVVFSHIISKCIAISITVYFLNKIMKSKGIKIVTRDESV